MEFAAWLSWCGLGMYMHGIMMGGLVFGADDEHLFLCTALLISKSKYPVMFTASSQNAFGSRWVEIGSVLFVQFQCPSYV